MDHTESDYKYYAFISYSHKDEKFAGWLHKKLETYKVSKKIYKADEKIPKRIFPVFRDRDELPVSSELANNINEALLESKYLIVICSPDAANSRWVDQEIIQFKKTHGENNIIPLILRGEPNTDLKDGNITKDECFPNSLKYSLNENGELSDLRVEPLCADFRKGADGKKNAFYKIIAGLIGVKYDLLKDREQERKVRKLAALSSTLSVLLLLLAGLSWIAYISTIEANTQRRIAFEQRKEAIEKRNEAEAKGREANEQRKIAEAQRDSTKIAKDRALQERDRAIKAEEGLKKTLASVYFNKANELIGKNQAVDALPYLVESVKKDQTNPSYKIRLDNILQSKNFLIPVKSVKITDNNINKMVLSNDGDKAAVIQGNSRVTVIDTKTFEVISDKIEHTGKISSVAFSPDGTKIVTSSFDNTARVWDANTGLPVTKLIWHKNWVFDAKFSSDNYFIMTISADSAVRVWDATTGKGLMKISDKKSFITEADFNPDETYIATGTYEHGAQLWNTETNKVASIPLVHKNYVFKVLFEPNGKYLLSASTDKVNVLNIEKNELSYEYASPNESFSYACFSATGDKFAIANSDGSVDIRATAYGGLLKRINLNDDIEKIEFSRDGNSLLTITQDNALRVWDIETGKAVSEPFRNRSKITSAYFTPEGNDVIVSLQNGEIEELEIKTLRTQPVILSHKDIITDAAVNPTGEKIMTVEGLQQINIWDVEKQKVIQSVKTDGYIINSAISKNLRYCLTFNDDSVYFRQENGESKTGRICLYDIKDSSLLLKINTYQTYTNNFNLSDDGKLFVLIRIDGTADIWNTETGRLLSHIAVISKINSAIFSPDSKYLLTASDNGDAILWKVENPKIIAGLMKHSSKVNRADFSSDGKLIVTASDDHTARIWDAKTYKLISEPLEHNKEVVFAMFSKNGKSVLTVTANNYLRVWDVKKGTALINPVKSLYKINHAEFDPTGSMIIASCFSDTTFINRIWDARSGNLISENNFPDRISKSIFSPDGSKFIVATFDGNLYINELLHTELVNNKTLDDIIFLSGIQLNENGVIMEIENSDSEVNK